MAKLNSESKNELKTRRATIALRKPSVFSIIFLGDAHVGMNQRLNPTCKYRIKNYRAILRSINSNDNTLISVFHGGDEGDKGAYVQNFVSITKKLMNRKHYRIPYFAGVGNHEYQGDPSLSEYKKYISSSDNDVIRLYGSNYGPKVAVIMLNTGGPSDSGCKNGSGTIIANSIAEIKNSSAYKAVIKDKTVKIIIDMHIPPRMPVFRGNPPTHHRLCPNAESHFKNFVNGIGTNRILFIVTHHKHGYIQPKINSRYLYLDKIPVFLTAQGGNCDTVSLVDKRSKYSYYKIDMSTNTASSRDNYKLKNAYRLDVDVNTSKVVKVITIY